MRGQRAAQTDDDGRYALDVPPERAYIVAVVDDIWTAKSLMNVVVHEGQSQAGLDFTLVKGTVLRGQVTVGPDHRPSGGAMVMLIENGELLPRDYRGFEGNKGQLMRATAKSNALGRYQFRVGPGRYTVQGFNDESQAGEDVTIEVKQEAEIVRDVALQSAIRLRRLSRESWPR